MTYEVRSRRYARMRKVMRRIHRAMSRIFFVVKVEGESMWPELIPQHRYFAIGFMAPRPGDMAVARIVTTGEVVVKRVASCSGDSYSLEGLVPWSSSYVVSRRDILGKVFG